MDLALRLYSAWAGENAAVDGNWARDNEAESAGAHPFSFVAASQTELGVDIFIFGVWLLGICDGKLELATKIYQQELCNKQVFAARGLDGEEVTLLWRRTHALVERWLIALCHFDS